MDRSGAELPLKRLAEIAYSTAFKGLRCDDDAKDVAQEAMARWFAWTKTHDPPRVPEAWISTVAANLVRNQLRDRNRHPRDQFRENGETAAVDGVEPEDFGIVEGYKTLSKRQREVLAWLYLRDLDVRTVARILGLGEETVRTHRLRALRALRGFGRGLDGDGSEGDE